MAANIVKERQINNNMINPEDNIPTDDQQLSEADDQQSQKDIHS